MTMKRRGATDKDRLVRRPWGCHEKDLLQEKSHHPLYSNLPKRKKPSMNSVKFMSVEPKNDLL